MRLNLYNFSLIVITFLDQLSGLRQKTYVITCRAYFILTSIVTSLECSKQATAFRKECGLLLKPVAMHKRSMVNKIDEERLIIMTRYC